MAATCYHIDVEDEEWGIDTTDLDRIDPVEDLGDNYPSVQKEHAWQSFDTLAADQGDDYQDDPEDDDDDFGVEPDEDSDEWEEEDDEWNEDLDEE